MRVLVIVDGPAYRVAPLVREHLPDVAYVWSDEVEPGTRVVEGCVVIHTKQHATDAQLDGWRAGCGADVEILTERWL